MADFNHWSFIIEKKVTSSDVLTASATNIAEIVGNGVVIEDVVVRTDATGLAGGTNFQLKADGIVFFSETVANLWASAIMDLNWASVTGIKALVTTGTKYISVQNTVADWTGAWVITLEFTCRKLDSTSTWNSI